MAWHGMAWHGMMGWHGMLTTEAQPTCMLQLVAVRRLWWIF